MDLSPKHYSFAKSQSSTSKTKYSHYLRYPKLSNISFATFLKESFFCGVNSYFEMLCFIFISVSYRLSSLSRYTTEIGIGVLLIKTLFCVVNKTNGSIGIVLGPFYSRQDFKNYQMYKNICCCITLVLFFVNYGLFFCLFGVIDRFSSFSELIVKTAYFLKIYGTFVVPVTVLSNYLLGIDSWGW